MKKVNRITVYLVSAITAMAIICGCASPPPPPRSIEPIDNSNATAVKASLNTDPDVASQKLEVTVVNNEVTLSGTVPNEEIKKKAESLAVRAHGVTKVTNNIKVVPDSQ